MRVRFPSLLLLAIGLPCFVAGCGSKPESSSGTAGTVAAAHDPDDVPITEADMKMPADYRAALPQIEGYRDTIRGAIQAKTPSKAHRSLDEAEIVLSKLPTIAKESGVPAEKLATVTESSRALREALNEVHAAIDAKKEPDYAAVSDRVEKAIGQLKAVDSAAKP
jgi:hypothetical protein